MKPAWASRAQASTSSSVASARPKWAQRGSKQATAAQPLKRVWRKSGLAALLAQAVLPTWWVKLALECSALAWGQPLLHGVEYFSGQGELQKAFDSQVGPFAYFDIRHGPTYDISTDAGVRTAMILLLRVASGGHLHFGTPCSSWVALSRSFTKRSSYQPKGPDKAHCTKKQWAYLQLHNRIAKISSYLMKLATLLGHTVSLEQPVSSLLFSYAPMVAALKDAISAPFHMGAFGGESPKPLKLVGTAAWLSVFRAVYLARKSAATKPSKRLT